MVYEYCDEIKNSGINRTIASSYSSYLEMGLVIEAEATNEFNAIFREAGMTELKNYADNLLTEASAKEVATIVKDKIVKALQAAWEKIKGVWEKIVNTIRGKIDEYNQKLGKQFDDLDLAAYKKVLDKVFDGKKALVASSDQIYELEVKLASNKDHMDLKKATDIEEYASNPYKFLLENVGAKKAYTVDGLDSAKKVIDEYIYKKETDSVTAEWVIKNKTKIARLLTQSSVGTINDAYKRAKKEIDKAIKQVKEVDKLADNGGETRGIDLKEFSRALINSELAYQNLLLYLADVRKKSYTQAIVIAGKCVHACKAGKEDKAEVNESLKLDSNFIDEAFAW